MTVTRYPLRIKALIPAVAGMMVVLSTISAQAENKYEKLHS